MRRGALRAAFDRDVATMRRQLVASGKFAETPTCPHCGADLDPTGAGIEAHLRTCQGEHGATSSVFQFRGWSVLQIGCYQVVPLKLAYVGYRAPRTRRCVAALDLLEESPACQ